MNNPPVLNLGKKKEQADDQCAALKYKSGLTLFCLKFCGGALNKYFRILFWMQTDTCPSVVH